MTSMNYLCDSHVHYYSCYDKESFFDEALSNFTRAAQHLNLNAEFTGCLFLTETSRDHYFQEFREKASLVSEGRWKFHKTAEKDSLLVEEEGKAKIVVVAGRQIISREAIEVLALGCDAEFAEGLSIQDTIKEVQEKRAIPVLPWGFGKWSGKRREVLCQFLSQNPKGPLFLGDTGQRAHFLAVPDKLGKDLSVLRGSDSYPFDSDMNKVGSYGSLLEGKIDTNHPAESLKKLIITKKDSLKSYGKNETLINFFIKQFKMQIRKIQK
jgi:hypothetical protein